MRGHLSSGRRSGACHCCRCVRSGSEADFAIFAIFANKRSNQIRQLTCTTHDRCWRTLRWFDHAGTAAL